MIEQPRLMGQPVFGVVPLDRPRWDCEEECFPRGLADTTTRYRAQSILADMAFTGQIHDALLPVEQARDVIAWHARHQAAQWRKGGRFVTFLQRLKPTRWGDAGALLSAA